MSASRMKALLSAWHLVVSASLIRYSSLSESLCAGLLTLAGATSLHRATAQGVTPFTIQNHTSDSVARCANLTFAAKLIAVDHDVLLDEISSIAFQKLEAAGDDFSNIEEPYRTVAIIFAAQGVIDNGGLVYFFENDWPHAPPYSVFADAYERIGRLEAAHAIRNAAASFGVDMPERECDRRRKFIDQHCDHEKLGVSGWDDCICGDDQVWTDLSTWVQEFSTD